MAVIEMREQIQRIAEQARDVLNQITDNTAEERAAEIEREFDAMMLDHDRLKSRLEREERMEQVAASANALSVDRLPPVGTHSAPAIDQAGPSYRSAFFNWIARGQENLNEAERAVLLEKRVQTAGTNAAGGFTVPSTLADFIVESMKAFGPMATSNLFTRIETSTGETFSIPTVDDTAVTAVAHTEGAELVNDGGKDVTFGSKTLGDFTFDTEWIRWSQKLDTDSVFNMESLLGRLLGERLGRIANAKLTTGSGSSDVEGIVVGSTAGVTAASATAIAADELISLQHSVDPAYRTSPSAAFMMNDSTLQAIRKLKDGDNRYLFQTGDYMQGGVPDRLLGYPIVVNQDMDSIATAKKTILFGDMSRYYVRVVGEPVVYIAREKFWPSLGIAGIIRCDGTLADTAAVKHLVQA